MEKQSWKYTEAQKQEIRDLYKTGVMPVEISRRTKISVSMVKYYLYYDKMRARGRRYYLRNRPKLIKNMRKYWKKRKEAIANQK